MAQWNNESQGEEKGRAGMSQGAGISSAGNISHGHLTVPEI